MVSTRAKNQVILSQCFQHCVLINFKELVDNDDDLQDVPESEDNEDDLELEPVTVSYAI